MLFFCILIPVSRLIINESYNLRFKTFFSSIVFSNLNDPNLLKLQNNGQLNQSFEQSVFDRYRAYVRKYLLRNLNLDMLFINRGIKTQK